MAPHDPRDVWLLPHLAALLPAEVVASLEGGTAGGYWEEVVRRGLMDDAALAHAVAARIGVPVADFGPAGDEVRELLPEHLARRYRVVPLGAGAGTVDVATATPGDLDCERALAFATGRRVRFALASPSRIAEALDELYRPESVVEKIVQTVSAKFAGGAALARSADVEHLDSGERGAERPVVRLVDLIIAEAIAERASDIHVEPGERELAVRYRIDGVLRQVLTLPRAVAGPLVSRVKIMCGLDIAVRLRPQDGRARVAIKGEPLDLRVSTLPAAHGEKVVIRILDARGAPPSLDAMGLRPEELARLAALLDAREGLILVTGPTGSGKSTTLYAALRRIQSRGVNTVTVEDPVEYRLPGVVQVQVHERAGLTFSSALRSILRQDPDVVLVGEIRDGETAGIAVQAALTGHLVLSTLHTIDAASSITRLADIGVEGYKIGAALKGIVAQRLVRRLCRACRVPTTDAELAALPAHVRRAVPTDAALYSAAGCPSCAMTGYRGRMAVVEVLVTTREVERCIIAGEPPDRVIAASRAAGMRSLWHSGLVRALDGETSLAELWRVLDPPRDGAPPSSATSSSAPRSAAGGRGARSPRGSAADAPPSAATPSPPLAPAAPQLTGRPIVLAQGDAQLRGLLRALLEEDGHQVVEAPDEPGALAHVGTDAASLVVVDLAGDDPASSNLLAQLHARRSTVPVLVLSARSDEESEVRAIEAGAADFVSRPLRPRALRARVRALVSRAHAG